MVEPSVILIIAIFLPLVSAAMLNLFSHWPKLRNITAIIFAGTTCYTVYLLASINAKGEVISAEIFPLLPSLPILFKIEPLGLIYAALAVTLWLVTIIYSTGYLNVTNDKHQTRFFIFTSLAIAAALGIAFAGNLITMLVFYEALTFSTYPLVTHKGDAAAIAAGRKYLTYLLSSSIIFFIPAIILTNSMSGSMEFTRGGILNHNISPAALTLLLLLFIYGIAKAAIMPLHKWLPSAMVAPTPVSALLHAVAVVKAGVFCISKIITYIFGLSLLAASGLHWLSYLAAFTTICASLIALREDNIKTRLAYSTIAQLGAIILATSLFTANGIHAAALLIIAHGLGKITLFFAAGAIITASGHSKISEMQGLGRRMPLVFACFFLASLSLIGLPGFAGAAAKHEFMEAAAGANQQWVIFILIISMVLNLAYYLPITYLAFCKKPLNGSQIHSPASMVFSIILTTVATIAFYFFHQNIMEFFTL